MSPDRKGLDYDGLHTLVTARKDEVAAFETILREQTSWRESPA
jgi:hypothetical protein